MARNPPSVDASVATTRELLNAALARSARRNARVANLRIAFRWVTWAVGQTLKYTLIALAVFVPLALAWQAWQQRGADEPTVVQQAPAAAPAARPASALAVAAPRVDDRTEPTPAPKQPEAAATAAVKVSPAAGGLRLRLDESITP
jgi:hypothetical protein